jgi:hypothetical protein
MAARRSRSCYDVERSRALGAAVRYQHEVRERELLPDCMQVAVREESGNSDFTRDLSAPGMPARAPHRRVRRTQAQRFCPG